MMIFIKKTVLVKYPSWKSHYNWLFKCSYCWNEKELNISNWKKTQSCWCISKKLVSDKRKEQSRESKVTIDNWKSIYFSLTNWWYCLIDKEDYELIEDYSWYKSVRWYVESRINWKLVKIHRFITNVEDWTLIDHINREKLDNRKINLRKATHKQNLHNAKQKTGKYKWVYQDKKWKYIARIKSKHLWSFVNENEAAMAYNEAAKKEFGEFAFLNIIV